MDPLTVRVAARALRIAQETDPQRLADEVTPAQRDMIMEAYENGGETKPEYGMRSLEAINAARTRVRARLQSAGILRGDRLTELGKQVAEVLKTRPEPKVRAPRPRKVPPASPGQIGYARQLLRENGEREPEGLDQMDKNQVSNLIMVQQARRKASPQQLWLARKLLKERGIREPEGLDQKTGTWMSSLLDGLQRGGRPSFKPGSDVIEWTYPARR